LSVIVDPANADADAAISGNKSEIVRSFFVMIRLHQFFEARLVRFYL
jgi:hypothetical protein